MRKSDFRRNIFTGLICVLLCSTVEILLAATQDAASLADSVFGSGTQVEDGNNYAGTVDVRVGTPAEGIAGQDLFTSGGYAGMRPGTLAYATGTKVTKESLRSRQHKGYSGECALILRHFANKSETVTSFPFMLNAGDYIGGVHFFPNNNHRLLLQIGDFGDLHSRHAFYVLDTTSRQLKKLIDGVTYARVAVSPDGRYIAFVRGGDVDGNTDHHGPEEGQISEISLRVVDVDSEKEMTVSNNDTVPAGGWAWTPQGTLLYAQIPIKRTVKGRESAKSKIYEDKPRIYEFTPTAGTSKNLMTDAWCPTPSPDSKSIAFFGSANLERPDSLSMYWVTLADGATLNIANRDGSNRRALICEKDEYPELSWHNNTHLMVVENSISTSTVHSSIASYEITSRKKNEVVTTKLPSRTNGEDLSIFYSTRLAPVSPMTWTPERDGLFLSESRFGVLNPMSGRYDSYVDFMFLDMKSKKLARIGTVTNSFSNIAWCNE